MAPACSLQVFAPQSGSAQRHSRLRHTTTTGRCAEAMSRTFTSRRPLRVARVPQLEQPTTVAVVSTIDGAGRRSHRRPPARSRAQERADARIILKAHQRSPLLAAVVSRKNCEASGASGGCSVRAIGSRPSDHAPRFIAKSRKSIGALGAAAGRERRDEAAAAVIDDCFAAIRPMLGTRTACAAVGRPRATHYRHQAPAKPKSSGARPAPLNKLSDEEAAEILEVLRSPRFVDLSPAQVFHTLLDRRPLPALGLDGHRLLRANGEIRERTPPDHASAPGPPRARRPAPLVVWSWTSPS